jgi:hypothetical protein
MSNGRDYKKEYDTYHSTNIQKKKRASRNQARALMIRKKGKSALAGKDVHHKDRNAMNNSSGNLSVASKSTNRGNNKG